MKMPFTPNQADFVDEQEEVEHDVQSGSVFRHDMDSSATESPVTSLLECAEVFL